MNCPVCGADVNGNQYCPDCGANMSVFSGVSMDKVIINQTPEQHKAAGDDSVTQLIPENYMTSKGDDSVTELIPENYMSATGDDDTTILIDPGQVKQPKQQSFVQQPGFSPAPSVNPVPPMNGYQQPMGQQQMGYQQPSFGKPAYQQGMGQPLGFGAVTKSVPKSSKVVSLTAMILMIALLVSCIILTTKPMFYITDSYYGGMLSGKEIEEMLIEQDPDDYEEANEGMMIMYGIVLGLVVIATLNAWSCFARINKGCVKSPVNKAVGNLAFEILGLIVFLAFKMQFDEVVVDAFSHSVLSPDDAAKFNVYSLVFILTIVTAFANVVNLITSIQAKQAVR